VKANRDFSKASAEMRCRMRNETYGRIEKSACEALQWSEALGGYYGLIVDLLWEK